MPLFRQSEARGKTEGEKRVVKKRKCRFKDSDHHATLTRLCLLSIAENMNDVWVRDYAQNYMDQYFFRYIMGPFSQLPSDLLEELLSLLASRRLVTRAALHLMLVPQLRHLSLGRCTGLVTSNLCAIIGARCQALLSLDLGGGVSVSSPVLQELLGSLANLRSLSLAGSMCDVRVLQTLPTQCPMLRHLDVSRCHHLNPVSLLFLSPKHPQSPGLPVLRSLLALDIGFGEWEEDGQATAAFLLLSLPWLERVALEALGEACVLLRDGDFHKVEEFICRTQMPDFRDLWTERGNGDNVTGMDKAEEESFSLSEATNSCLWIQDSEDEDEGESNGIEGACHDFTGAMASENTRGNGALKVQQEDSLKGVCLTLRLRQVQGVSFGSLGPLGQLCPDLSVLTLDYSEEEEAVSGDHLARVLARWSASLRSLTLRFPGPLSKMARSVAAVGASLTTLTLEGVRADGLDPLLRLLHSCPQLTTLTIHMEPPRMHQEEESEEEDREEDLHALPCLPRLSCLALNFAFDQRQKRTPMSWRSLKGALWALLRGAPLLETVSLVAAPCPLNPVFRLVLDHPAIPMRASQSPALQHLRDLNLARSDVSMATVSRLVAMDIPLSTLDLSGCWAVTLHDIRRLGDTMRRQKLHIKWT
ncbi:uncharacterized protein si:ch211-214j8.12 [Alosa sapidissima]|uniref:uncharacterized protein si:ch211-214j8.12 n=1 Tax=Alosa sapidissima TaxID=34773 RepID=UPI001C0821AA|nr:uncharacterized protein si:ch211-214j8.12 [Alosa sapidissima]